MKMRGCGSRVQNGVYWELGLGIGGKPLEDFLIDPPMIVPSDMAIPKRGQLMVPQNILRPDGTTKEVWHLIDRVGMGLTPAGPGYWNVADFVEEVREMGLSRRLNSKLDFSKLTAESRVVLVHDRAWIDNPAELFPWTCPKDIEGHEDPGFTCCAGVWWEDIEGGSLTASFTDRQVKRTMPSFDYVGRHRPVLDSQGQPYAPVYRPAFFASFPASRLVVVAGDQAAERLEKIQQSGLRTAEVDE